MKWIYQLFLFFYPLVAKGIAPFNAKAKKWVLGRKDVFTELAAFVNNSNKRIIWMHCASLGEFEQGLPVATALKKQYPHHQFLISFFSPSGYTVRKDHPIANFVCYLPMDSAFNANQFLTLVKPEIAIFIKYEFWHYYLKALKARNIPVLLVSGIFRQNQLFFKWYGGFYRNMLQQINCFFVQDEQSKRLLDSLNINLIVKVSGDTRFDRVIAIANEFNENATIAQFCGNAPIIVAGSTWSEDDKALHHLAIENKAIKFIVAPHDIEKERLQECLQFYPDAILYSEYQYAIQHHQLVKEPRTLVINNMGMLSSIYHYASIAFIGGGFTDGGIHNTLEAAVYGVPVVFGPVYEKYLEAVELIEQGGASSALDIVELEEIILSLLQEPAAMASTGLAAKKYVQAKAGATKEVVDYIQENRLLII